MMDIEQARQQAAGALEAHGNRPIGNLVRRGLMDEHPLVVEALNGVALSDSAVQLPEMPEGAGQLIETDRSFIDLGYVSSREEDKD